MEKKDNLLILGANGFLGKNVLGLLKNRNLFNLFKLNGKNELDLTKDNLLDNYIKKNDIDYVINCAAFVGGIAYGYDYPAELLTKNSLMALNLYEACKNNQVKFLVNPISNCAYPGNQELYEEKYFWEGAPHESVFEYGLSKKLFVALGNSYFKEYKLSSANIVLSNMYGPGDHFDEKKSHALGAMIKKIYSAKINNEKTVEIWGTGMPIREWLYVEDGAESLIKSTELKSGCYFYNIGVNKGISIIEMSKLIAEIIGWDGEFVFDTSKPDGAKEKRVLGGFAEDNLNWKPKVSLDNGIKTTIEWYKNNVINYETQ